MGPQMANLAVYGLYDRGVKKSTLGVKNRPSHLGSGRSYIGLGGEGQNTRPKAFPRAFWGLEPVWTPPNGGPNGKFGCVWPVWQRGQKVDIGGQKSTCPPRSRKVIYGSGSSKYASKNTRACILTSLSGLDASKWAPKWQTWLDKACMPEGSKSRLCGSKIDLPT